MRCNVNEFGITISETDGLHLAVAEASIVSMDPSGRPVLYFNRINVPKGMTQKGLGTAMLKKLLDTVKSNNWALICEVNPYGDLNRDQLIKWYVKHGFVMVRDEEHEELWFNL